MYRFDGIKIFFLISMVLFLSFIDAHSEERKAKAKSNGQIYKLDKNSVGYMEKIDNILNFSVVSIDDNVYKAEYEAGFIQGKLQREQIIYSRDNLWDIAYLTDQSPNFVKSQPPGKDEIAAAQKILIENYNYTLNYIQRQCDPRLRENFAKPFFLDEIRNACDKRRTVYLEQIAMERAETSKCSR